ncbi:MAG TPA: PQQ-dependent sugar dehydrogenase [Candidatus Limnocylindria bacterium]
MPGHLRRRRYALILVIGLLAGLLPQAAMAAAPSMTAQVVRSGLSFPWDVAFLPDGQMLVTERAGRVRVYASGSPGAALVRTVNISVTQVGESGLMGIAVDVDFASNRYVYVCASQTVSGAWRNRVLRYTVAANGAWGGLKVLVGGMLANNIHNGCAVEMSRDGRLWVSMGDAGNGSLAQNRSSLNGKILRMNREGGTPADNPVIGGLRNIVYSMGHRNVQGLAIRPGTGQVYAVEHGPDVNDEINRIVAGGNYGWPCHTGNVTSACGSSATTIGSLWASGGSTIATSGGAFVGGAQWADYNGHLFVSTLKQRDVRRFSINAAGTSLGGPALHFDQVWGRLRASTLGPGGQLYLTTSNGGASGQCPSGDCVIRVKPATPAVNRIAGANRYATAAALSVSGYPSGASDVMVATGLSFPDALAGSAAAGMLSMPVLLTQQTSLPSQTRAELARLKPQRIWVLGGTSVISEGVRSALVPYASTGQVTRVSGADRYGTAAEISERWYASGAQAAFVAVGTNFADALAGGPAAALRDSPLLLVKTDSIPGSTQAELNRLKPQRIYVLGGTAVINAAVATALDAYTTGPVTRLAGANRFATAEAITRTFWPTKVSPAYVASGMTFPDALAGGAVAGKQGLPMLLANQNDATLYTGQEILRLSPLRLTMLGGTASLSASVETRLKRLLATP